MRGEPRVSTALPGAATVAVIVLLALALLAACSSGPKRRVFAPEARINELAQADGGWRLQLRIHNYSNVPMTVERVQLALEIDAAPAGEIVLDPRLTVAANSVELVDAMLPPAPAAAAAFARGGGLAYRLHGVIVTREPNGRHASDFSSRLDRVPGLDGVLR